VSFSREATASSSLLHFAVVDRDGLRPAHWIEIDAAALRHNLGIFRRLLSPDTRLAAVVKANAYGHGLAEAAPLVAETADWLAVHSAEEARTIRRAGVAGPILVMGFVPPVDLHDLDRDVHVFVSCPEVLGFLGDYRRREGVSLPVHLKVDTGTKRQGAPPEDLGLLCRQAARERLEVVGIATHFANIEDTLEHDFARLQMERFDQVVEALRTEIGGAVPWIHAACSAAALLFRRTDYTLARVGISMYGHWPSRETQLSWRMHGGHGAAELIPALSWRAVVGQLQQVDRGETVGYGRTWTGLRETVLAVLPVGYSDGYPRALGNRARVAVRGRLAPVVGRVCMNIMMVDVTDVPDVAVGDVVTLIGSDGAARVSAEELATHAGTINYELLARLSPTIPRAVVASGAGSAW